MRCTLCLFMEITDVIYLPVLLFLPVEVSEYVYARLCVCVCVFVGVSMSMCEQQRVGMCVSVCVCVCVCVCLCVCEHERARVCVCVYETYLSQQAASGRGPPRRCSVRRTRTGLHLHQTLGEFPIMLCQRP